MRERGRHLPSLVMVRLDRPSARAHRERAILGTPMVRSSRTMTINERMSFNPRRYFSAHGARARGGRTRGPVMTTNADFRPTGRSSLQTPPRAGEPPDARAPGALLRRRARRHARQQLDLRHVCRQIIVHRQMPFGVFPRAVRNFSSSFLSSRTDITESAMPRGSKNDVSSPVRPSR